MLPMDENPPIFNGGREITKVDCGWDPACIASKAAGDAFQSAIDALADSVLAAVADGITSLGTLWVNIGTPNLTASGDGASAINAGTFAGDSYGPLTEVLGYVFWVGLAVAVLSLLALGALMAIRMRRGEGLAAVGKLGLVLGGVLLISTGSAIVGGVLPSGPSNAGGAVLFIQSGLWWYMGIAAAISVVIGGIRMVWEQRAEPGRDTVKGLLTLILVAGGGTTVIGLLVAAADAFAKWIIDKSLQCDAGATTVCFSENLAVLLGITVGVGGFTNLAPFVIIIIGLCALLTSVIQIILMVARGGMLVLLAGILPLSASFTNTEMGRSWFKKSIGWLVAFILYKPAAAVVYAAAFQLAGTELVIGADALLAVLTGLMLMLLAVFALPALLRFTTPMVGAMASGSGGVGGAMALGAVAALPSGAISSRAASGGSQGGGSAPGAPSSGGGSAGASGSSGSSASGASQGGSGAAGATGSGASGAGSPGASGTGSSGASGSAKSGAGGGPGSTGAGGATGAGAASGAGGATGAGAASGAGGATGAGAASGAGAAGPVGAGAAAALQAGQAAAGGVKSVGEQATSDEGGGPDGSR